jgi:Tol biopolymer transport system component
MKRSILSLLALSLMQPYPAGAAEPGEDQFLSNVRQLTYEGRRAGEGYFSPDGRALVFQSERDEGNPFYQIFLLDLETGDSHRVSPGIGKTTCAFFRPGTDELLFASTHLDAEAKAKQKGELDFRASGQSRRYAWDYDETMDIFSARRDGSQVKRLTTAHGYDAEGAYSPDGKLIVFCSTRDAFPLDKLSPPDRQRYELDAAYFGEIYLMNADGSDVRRLTQTPGYDGGPFFSPDGQRIIWRRFNEKGDTADIYTMKLDGSDVRRLTDFRAMSWAPYFHPSGQYAIFASNKLGFSNFELYLVDAAGAREPVRVTFTDGFDGLPVFSPDGKKLCWTSNRTSDGKSQLFMGAWDHEAAVEALEKSGIKKQFQNIGSAYSPLPPPLVRGKVITPAELRIHVEFLASDKLEGRLTGTEGNRLAAEHIATQLRQAGLQPLGDNGTFFEDDEFNAGVKVVTHENQLTLTRTGDGAPTVSFDVEKDFRPLSFTANGTAEGGVVFAGYGLTVPGKLGEGYDSYAGIDVSNKVVMVLRYVPEGVDPKRRAELNRYAGLRYKALIARTQGARAILIVGGPNSPNAGELAPLTMDTSLSGSGIIAASISGKVADALLGGTGKTLKALQDELDVEHPHAKDVRFTFTNLTLKVSTSVERIKKTDRNVIAVLPPVAQPSRLSSDGQAGLPPHEAEYIMLGAHFDHLGRGETGGFGIKGEEGQIHNGADDNASGVAVMLELAANLAAEWNQGNQGTGGTPVPRTRGVIFSFWSGEELGLIGSSHFAEKPTVNLSNVVAYLNFDMVGRLRENKLTLQGIGSSTIWKRLIEKRNVAAGFDLSLQEDPYLPTDTTPFYPKGIPVMAFFTGSHEEYHRPGDDADTLNYEGMERITKFARGITLDLLAESDRPDYVKVEKSSQGGSRDGLRAYLGTIPDYATESKGVKLQGARGGSPADKAGIKPGDVIVKFAGQKITNIYDFTYALDAVKIGEPVKVTVLREGQEVELTIIPEARN